MIFAKPNGTDKNGKTKYDAIAAGVVSNEPIYKTVGANNSPLLVFGLRYGSDASKPKGQQGKFLDVQVFGNQAIGLNGRIQQGDCIMAAGEMTSWTRNDGKVSWQLTNNGEVFPALAYVAQMWDSMTGGSNRSDPELTAAPAEPVVVDADGFQTIDDNEDLPF